MKHLSSNLLSIFFIETKNQDFAMVYPLFCWKKNITFKETRLEKTGWTQTMGETPFKFFVINFEATLLSLLVRFWRKAILEGCHLPSPEPHNVEISGPWSCGCGRKRENVWFLGGRCKAGCWTNVLERCAVYGGKKPNLAEERSLIDFSTEVWLLFVPTVGLWGSGKDSYKIERGRSSSIKFNDCFNKWRKGFSWKVFGCNVFFWAVRLPLPPGRVYNSLKTLFAKPAGILKLRV